MYEFYPSNEDSEKNRKILPHKANIDPSMQNKLKLDFSVLKVPKQSVQKEIYKQPPASDGHGQKNIKSKVQTSILDHEDANKKDKHEGFHQEFMSKFNEFSASWRQAALKELKHQS